MATIDTITDFKIKTPFNIMTRKFTDHKTAYYHWMLQEAPVCKAKMAVMNVYLLSRYEDCVNVLTDPRFIRNRKKIGGKTRFPFPVPKTVKLLAESMILEDKPEHTRLRGLVQKAFTPGALSKLEGRIQTLTHELLDDLDKQSTVDLIPSYSLPIPVTVIREMVGVSEEDMPKFQKSMSVLSEGMSGFNLVKTFAWDMKKTVNFVKDLIEKKRVQPEDDILTRLIQAEEEGERLTENELISMVFLLIFAGYETTVHLITNGVLALLQHPEQLDRLRAEPELMDSAVEEILRFAGPIHGTKPMYAAEDVTLHGVTIPKGAMTMPILGAANLDPSAFNQPDVFDIGRTPNRHLAFGHGMHYCLGAPLARLETKWALAALLERNPNLRLAVDPSELRLQNIPGWHRYENLPVHLG